MQKETVIYLMRTASFFEAEELGRALCKFVQAAQGPAAASWVENAVKIRIQNLPRAMIKLGIKVLIDSIVSAKTTLSIVEMKADIASLPYISVQIPWGSVLSRPLRLSKRLLVLLPSQSYIVSHRNSNGCSVFAEKLGNKREDAWRRAVATKAVGRSCYIAWSASHFAEVKFLLNSGIS